MMLAALAACLTIRSDAAPADASKKTYTYKTVGGVEIQADVYRPNDSTIRPAIAWFHGGALIVGGRDSIQRQLLPFCRQEGYALVSFDYRLAPEAKLPAIVEDVEDAMRWLHEQGPKELHIDPERVVVAGGSAGGYITLLTGYRVNPRPKALVSYWGYGDINGDWYTKPSEHYRKERLVSREKAYGCVGHGILTHTEGDQGRERFPYYLYLRQNGLWTTEVSGLDPTTKEGRKKLEPYCPVRNVSANYPPTLLIHGTADTDVPYEQSVEMEKALTRQKIPHELITVPDGSHTLNSGDKKLIEAAHAKALAFIREHLK
jgi:acetyl esterase/lipase